MWNCASLVRTFILWNCASLVRTFILWNCASLVRTFILWNCASLVRTFILWNCASLVRTFILWNCASLVRTFILVSLHRTIIYVSKRIHDILIVTVDGAWSLWSRWSRCSATCGHGVRKRSRQCTSPRPKFGGRLCDGHPLQTVSCRVKRHCPGMCSLSTREVQHLRNVALFTLLF